MNRTEIYFDVDDARVVALNDDETARFFADMLYGPAEIADIQAVMRIVIEGARDYTDEYDHDIVAYVESHRGTHTFIVSTVADANEYPNLSDCVEWACRSASHYCTYLRNEHAS